MTSKIYWLYSTKDFLISHGVKESSICENLNEHGLIQCELTEEQAQALIPKDTDYCYTRKGGGCERCPFWDLIEQFPRQSNGFCHFMKRGDFTGKSFGMLWDSIKECGIGSYNHDEENEK
jgi:hypothetical protein